MLYNNDGELQQRQVVQYSDDHRGSNFTPSFTRRRKQYGPWKKARDKSINLKQTDKFAHVIHNN